MILVLVQLLSVVVTFGVEFWKKLVAERAQTDYMGMLATVMNALALQTLWTM